MPAARKFLVVESVRRPNFPMPREWEDSIPFVAEMPGDNDDPGLVVLADGSIKRILKISGQNLSFLAAEHEEIAATFEKMLACVQQGSELQLLSITRPLDHNRYIDTYLEMRASENEYLDWYADYTSKWFRRVCDITFVPQKDFYVIVSEHKSGKANDSSVKQISRLDRRTAEIGKVIKQACMKAEVLCRSEARKLIYSSLRLSYSQGLNEAPVETLTKSSLPKVEGAGSKQYIEIDGQFVVSHVLSDLPPKACLGWLMGLVVIGLPASLSIHIRPRTKNSVKSSSGNLTSRANDVDSSHFYDVSMYISTFHDSVEDSEDRRECLKTALKNQNVLLSGKCDQFSAWISTLPLGLDSGGIAHCIPVEDARLCWPFFTDKCGSTSGFPLGFARSSREPVFLCPTESKSVFALASNEADLKFFQSMLTLRMISSNHHVLYFDAERDELSMLTRVLGPNLTNDWRTGLADMFYTDSSDADWSGKSSSLNWMPDIKPIEKASLTLLKSGDLNSIGGLNRFKRTVKTWIESYSNGVKPLVIFIGDINKINEGAFGLEALTFLFDFAKEMEITVITGVLSSETKKPSQLASLIQQQDSVKMVLPTDSTDRKHVKRLFSLGRGAMWFVDSLSIEPRISRQLNCFILSSENRGVVRMIPSPMDFWLCAASTPEHDLKIEKMMTEIRQKNPKLSEVDATRQTVYYLGMQAET